MTPRLPVLLLTLALAGCGNGATLWSPSTWFGAGDTPEDTIDMPDESLDPRPLVATVTQASLDPVASGFIVRATGLPPTQGWWEADLMPLEVKDGVLVLDFRLSEPMYDVQTGTPRSREVVVAYNLSARRVEREGIRRIIVRGQGNERALTP